MSSSLFLWNSNLFVLALYSIIRFLKYHYRFHLFYSTDSVNMILSMGPRVTDWRPENRWHSPTAFDLCVRLPLDSSFLALLVCETLPLRSLSRCGFTCTPSSVFLAFYFSVSVLSKTLYYIYTYITTLVFTSLQ
jgi:hypothetical protein